MEDKFSPQEICDSAIGYTNKVKGNIDLLIRPLKDGESIGENLQEFGNLLEGLQWLNSVMIAMKDLYKFDYADFAVGENDRNGEEVIASYYGFVQDLSTAMDEEQVVKFRKLLSGSLPTQMTAVKGLFRSLKGSFELQ